MTNIILNELETMGFEFKVSKLFINKIGLHCLDIYKDGKYVTHISPAMDKPLITSDGRHWSIQDIFVEFYNITHENLLKRMLSCTIEEYYANKQELKNLGFIKMEIGVDNTAIDEEINVNGIKLTPSLELVKFNNMWVAKETNHYLVDCCIERYIYFKNMPDEEMVYKALGLVNVM